MDITGIGTAVIGVKDIIGMFCPDKTEEDKAKMAQAFQVMQLQAQQNQAQDAVNAAAAAKQPITFRDGAGWVCVAGFAVTVLRPLITWASILVGSPVTLPPMDMTEIMPMLVGLLGLGGMHMNESIQGTK
jgi:hypothetical protein